MLAHLPADSLAASSATLAWIGALVLIAGEAAALLSLPNLVRVFVLSTVAELGYVLIGFGAGGPAGDTGALMHLFLQAVMRGLVLAAGYCLVKRSGSANLNDLAGAGKRTPATATLFGFGVFAVMGLSPFKGSVSKFIVLYAAIDRGLWPVALIGTIATVIAAPALRWCLSKPGVRTTVPFAEQMRRASSPHRLSLAGPMARPANGHPRPRHLTNTVAPVGTPLTTSARMIV